MQVTVFGASGKVGQLVVKQLLADGHRVVAFVHGHAPFEESDHLKIRRGDIHNAPDVKAAIVGSEIVISTLGSWGTTTKDILGSAMGTIIPAMKTQDITRIVSLTGSGAFAPQDRPSPIDKLSHTAFGLIAGSVLRDGEKHLRLLDASDLDWTVIRSPAMRSFGPASYHLNTKTPFALATVHRQAVVHAIVDQLTATDFLRQAPHIHSAK